MLFKTPRLALSVCIGGGIAIGAMLGIDLANGFVHGWASVLAAVAVGAFYALVWTGVLMIHWGMVEAVVEAWRERDR